MSTDDHVASGYKRPPEQTRFKPGRSGNPKGRPKGTHNLKADITSLLQKRVPIRHDGELRHVTRQEAMLLTLYAKAVQGDTRASSQLFAMLTKVEKHDANAAEPDVVTDNDRAIVEDFLRRNSVSVKKEGDT